MSIIKWFIVIYIVTIEMTRISHLNKQFKTSPFKPKVRTMGYKPNVVVPEVKVVERIKQQYPGQTVKAKPYKRINKNPLRVEEVSEELVYPKIGLNNQFRTAKEKFVVKHHKDGVMITGSCLVCELNSQPDTKATISTVIPLHPAMLNSWQLARMSENYQKYIFKDVRVEIVSALATTTAGNIFGCIFPSNETVPPLNGLPLKKFLQSNCSFKENSAFETLHIAMPKSKFLPAYNVQLEDDYTTSVQGNVYLGSTNLNSQYIGDAIVHYTVLLLNMTAPPVADQSGTILVMAVPTANSLGAGAAYQYLYTYGNDLAAYTYWSAYPGIWQVTLRTIPTNFNYASGQSVNQILGATYFMRITNVSSTSVALIFYPTYTNALTQTLPMVAAATTTLLSLGLYGYWLTTLGQQVPVVQQAPPPTLEACSIKEYHYPESHEIDLSSEADLEEATHETKDTLTGRSNPVGHLLDLDPVQLREYLLSLV